MEVLHPAQSVTSTGRYLHLSSYSELRLKVLQLECGGTGELQHWRADQSTDRLS